jgi:hypothetical protein
MFRRYTSSKTPSMGCSRPQLQAGWDSRGYLSKPESETLLPHRRILAVRLVERTSSSEGGLLWELAPASELSLTHLKQPIPSCAFAGFFLPQVNACLFLPVWWHYTRVRNRRQAHADFIASHLWPSRHHSSTGILRHWRQQDGSGSQSKPTVASWPRTCDGRHSKHFSPCRL